MNREIYKETQYAKWFAIALLAGWIGVPLIIGYITITFELSMPVYVLICLCLHIIGIPFMILYLFKMQTSIDDTCIIISRLLGLVKKKIKLNDIIFYEIVSCGISDIPRFRYGKNRIISYVVIDLKDFLLGIEGKGIKLKTQKGDYLIGTQNPEKIMEILKAEIGNKKELQNP